MSRCCDGSYLTATDKQCRATGAKLLASRPYFFVPLTGRKKTSSQTGTKMAAFLICNVTVKADA